jgi:peptide/nickel transport system permease protein
MAQQILRKKEGILIAGGAILLVVVLSALLAGYIYPQGPWVKVADPFIAPFSQAALPLGTDALGRDVLVMLVYGARVSITIGLVATVAAVTLGVLVGALAGYVRGWVDDVLMRFTEIFQTIPGFIFVIVLVVILQPTLATIIIAIAVTSWPPVARLVRAEFLTLGGREFVQSCRVIGMPHYKIIFGEILPNCLTSVLVIGSVMVATAVLVEAGLSFLGLGDPNLISWGGMVATGRPVIQTAPYLSIIPGLAIFLLVMAINFVGQGLTNRFNPRLNRAIGAQK